MAREKNGSRLHKVNEIVVIQRFSENILIILLLCTLNGFFFFSLFVRANSSCSLLSYHFRAHYFLSDMR